MYRRELITSTLGAALLSAFGLARAQSSKTVRIVVPFAAGGVQDILARALSNELSAALGQPVIVENKAGAGGTIGNAYVARAAADGTVMVAAAVSHNIVGTLYSKLSYDPQKDFVPYAYIGRSSYVLMTNAGVPAKNAAEFINHARANPGKLNYASSGVGSAAHLAMAHFCSMANIDLVHVPLKATGEAVHEVLSGRAHAMISATIGALPFARESRVRLLGVTSPKPSKYLPDLPAVAESGLPGYHFDTWFGFLGPAGTPPAQVERIHAAVGKLLRDPTILERLDKQGVEPQVMTNADFAKLLAIDHERISAMVKAAGAKLD